MNGTVIWIGIRPERKAPVQEVDHVYADSTTGLSGDHDAKPERQVTLISREALEVVAQHLGKPSVDPAATRRNLLISGMDFDLDRGTRVEVGDALLEVTGPCLPCDRMEENLGAGGRVAMAEAAAGGLTARIIRSGNITQGDPVQVLTGIA